METQIDICQQTQMIKSIQTKKMDVSNRILQKKNQLADGIYLGFMFQKNPEDYDLIIKDIMGTNKKLNKGEISYQEKINYYNEVMNNEVKKEKVLKYIYFQEEQIKKQQALSQSQILQDNMRSQIKSLIQQPLQFQGECKICLGQLSEHQSYRLAQCQHVFHKDCLILHGKNWQALPVLCPQCKTEIMQHDLNEICDTQTKIRLTENSFKLYLQRTRDIYICPTPDCYGVFVVDVNCLQKMATFFCSICQLSYCPRCKKAPHQGACQQGSMIQVVNNKMYRRCNKCGMMIEKDGGCNHVVCICKNEFCYGCGKEWINREQFYCFCESELEMKIARMLGLQQREFKEPEKPAQNLEQRITREINYALDGLLINVTRLIGRAHRRHLARKQQQQQKN